MKFCYVDESGYGSGPIFVMAGIVVDAMRMHVTKKEWMKILKELSRILNKPIREFHTRHFYRGHGIWYDLNGNQRAKLMTIIIEWLRGRHHAVVFAAVDKKKAKNFDFKGKENCLDKCGKPNYWLLAALHIMLCVQKRYQRESGIKGHTVMIFDHESKEEGEVGDIALNPPEWSDSFYGYNRNSRKKDPDLPLSHIVDVPYFADSMEVGMLQVADLFAYLIRYYAELETGYSKVKYPNEKTLIDDWVKEISQFMLEDSYRWPATGSCECAQVFRSIAPEPLLNIQRRLKN